MIVLCLQIRSCPSKNDLRSGKNLIPLHEFMTSKASIYDPGWLPSRIVSYLVGRPLWWALEQTGIVGDEGTQSRNETNWWGEYVVVELVEKAADGVLSLQQERMRGSADALYTWEEFRRTFSSVFGSSHELLNETDARVILKYLERERQQVVLSNEVRSYALDKETSLMVLIQVIKFVEGSTVPGERIITSVDHGILELKSAIHNLQHQIDSVQRKIDECGTIFNVLICI